MNNYVRCRRGMHLERKDQGAGPPGWTTKSWLSSLALLDTLSEVLLAESDHTSDEVSSIKNLSDEMIATAVDAAAVRMKAELKDAVAALRKTKEVNAHVLNEKFAADKDTFTFRYGGMEEYHGGLEGMIGNPDPRVAEAVEWEHMKSSESTKVFECWWKGETSALAEYDYVANQPATEEDTKNGRREMGRDSWTLKTFMQENSAMVIAAGLQEVEVVVLRLYTGQRTSRALPCPFVLLIAAPSFCRANVHLVQQSAALPPRRIR